MISPMSAEILPISASIKNNRIAIADCNLRDLAEQFGTPLYIYDEETIRTICRQYISSFEQRLSGVRILYAAKAYLSPALVSILVEEGLGIDVVSGGELHIAQTGGMPPEHIGMHGNAKSRTELIQALNANIGRIIIDNEDEINLLDQLTRNRSQTQNVMLRITPGVDARTHTKTTTGLRDSKFGFPLPSGQAASAVQQVLSTPHLNLTGFHIHLGSPIYTTDPYKQGIAVATAFASEMRNQHGYEWREFSPGGGFAIGYTHNHLPPSIDDYAKNIATALHTACKEHKLPIPEVHIEPGRSIVGRAGVALYSVVARKHIPGVRKYIAVDGGMADNPRPALYESTYEALAPEKITEPTTDSVTIAGKFCESGDILVKDAQLPELVPGDLVAIPASGAYQLAMESNYNLALRPAVVILNNGKPRLIRHRQTLNDLLDT